jgi:uncharacterized protein (TIGR03066 family)
MKNLLFLLLLFASCQANKDYDIVGTWTSENITDNTDLNISDQSEFNKDGSYNLTVYSNGDSLVSKISGTYSLDKTNQTIAITMNGITFHHKIIEMSDELLKLKTQQGAELAMKRVK